MVKAVVDVEKTVMAIAGGLHVDEESYLLERGSVQENLWVSISIPTVIYLKWWSSTR